MNVITDTDKFIKALSDDGTFSTAQAERLKDVLSKEINVVTEDYLDRALLHQTITFLLSLIGLIGVLLAIVNLT
jgi:hypothetical protein